MLGEGGAGALVKGPCPVCHEYEADWQDPRCERTMGGAYVHKRSHARQFCAVVHSWHDLVDGGNLAAIVALGKM